MPNNSFVRNIRGMALLNMVFLFIFIGVLVASGMQMYGSMVARAKVNNTKRGLEDLVRVVVAWAAKNGRLPTAAEYPGVFGGAAPLDAWGRQLAYVYDDTVANTGNAKFGGLCGRTSSNLQDGGTNIAFALVSGGDDYSIQTAVNGAVVTAPTMDVVGAAPQNLANYQTDLYRPVPLEEMKSKAGCYGTTGGRLRIVNNELPSGCADGTSTYMATLFADGGVPGYTWAQAGSFPNGLSPANTNTVTGKISPNALLYGPFSVAVTLTDSSGSSVQRTYNIPVTACTSAPPGTPSNPVTFNNPSQTTVENNWNGGISANDTGLFGQGSKIPIQVANGILRNYSTHNGTSDNCIWFQTPLTLPGKKLRAYFNFTFTDGFGFALAMRPAYGNMLAQDSCDSKAQDYAFGSGIPGYGTTLLGIIFGALDHSGKDQYNVCATLDGGFNSTCTANETWTTSKTYNVRFELDDTVNPNPTLKVWMCPNTQGGSCSASNIAALSDITTAYIGTWPTLIPTLYLSIPNSTDLSSFFLGFTTSQRGGNPLGLTLSGLNFALY